MAHERGSAGRPAEPGRRAFRRAAKLRALATRRRARLIVTGVVALLVVTAAVVQLGIDRLAELGAARPSAPSPTAAGSAPVLNPEARPTSTSAPSATESPPILASVAFDLLPVGPLEAEPPVASVIGAPEVVAFPSPLDRSLELAGPADAGLCVSVPGLRGAPLVVFFDVYVQSVVGGALAFVADAASEPPVTLAVASGDLAGLAPGQWYALALHWDGDARALLEGGIRGTGGATFEARFESADTRTSADQAACLELVGAGATSLMIDNLRIEQ